MRYRRSCCMQSSWSVWLATCIDGCLKRCCRYSTINLDHEQMEPLKAKRQHRENCWESTCVLVQVMKFVILPEISSARYRMLYFAVRLGGKWYGDGLKSLISNLYASCKLISTPGKEMGLFTGHLSRLLLWSTVSIVWKDPAYCTCRSVLHQMHRHRCQRGLMLTLLLFQASLVVLALPAALIKNKDELLYPHICVFLQANGLFYAL